MKKILHLTLIRLYFDFIAAGFKTEEYREIKPYWTNRFHNPDGSIKEFDEVHFRNGYHPTNPFMRVEWIDLNVVGCSLKGYLYAIKLGKVIKIKNHKFQKVPCDGII